MSYLLDTNTCIRFINGRSVSIRNTLDAKAEKDIHISVITQAEMFYGSYKSEFQIQSRAIQDEFFKRFNIVMFDSLCADIYGKIRVPLEKQGKVIGGNDMLIAATALAHQLILVTHNTREFSRIEGLQVEDWEI